MADVTTISVDELTDTYKPSTYQKTWAAEAADIDARLCLCCGRPGHYQQMLETYIAEHGLEGQGVCVNAGLVKDGHHRVVAAVRLGITEIPLESEDEADEWWVRDHGPVDWLGRRKGDITAGELSWLVVDAMRRMVRTR